MTLRLLRPTTPALAGVVLSALLLAGCAAPPQLAALRAQGVAGLPERAQVERVPFFAQPGDTLCGPTTLAMVAQAAGRTVTPEQLTPQVYLPGRQGALQAEMLAAARRNGLVPYVIEPSLKALLRELANGAPVLVLQNLSLPMAPQWHYAVAVGYDWPAGEIELHSGTTERLRMPLSTFERTWGRSQHWAVRVAAPDAPPTTADGARWAAAVAPLERLDVQAAHTAYQAGLRRWPQVALLHFGAGNTAHALGASDDARRAFEAATELQPDFADAWNNLAWLRLQRGDAPGARAAAERAVALGGPRLAAYQATWRATQAPGDPR
jgi:tetratricopeptide (TPR) repeat protein